MEVSKLSGPRACRQCAASKAKCDFLPEGSATNGKCRRCNRLNKDCTMQTAAPRRPKKQKTTRVVQLEEKLDSLVSLLKSSQQPPNSTSLSFHEQSQLSTPEPKDVLLHDQEDLLNLFRDEMSNQFPFVVIPTDTTASDLNRDKPFVLKVICMVAFVHDSEAQSLMAKEIMEYLSMHLIIQAERDLDLLQGLLIFMAWTHFHLHLARRFSTLLQLALSLVIDLRLNRATGAPKSHDETQGTPWVYSREDLSEDQQTLEQRRAFLGLIYLMSFASVWFQEVYHYDPIPNSKYVEHCAYTVEASAQFPSDQYLIHLVRLQHIAEEFNQALPHDSLDSPLMSSAPISLCIRSLQEKLNMFRSSLPTRLQQNPFLLMHYHSILIYLTETALAIPLTSRGATLHACLSSTHSFLAVLFSIPTFEYYKITYVTWIQLSHLLGVLAKLSSFESNDWDPSHVQGVLDLSLVLDGLIARFESLIAARSADGVKKEGSDLLSRVVPRFREYKEAFEKRRGQLIYGHTPTSQELIELSADFDMGDWREVKFDEPDEAFWQEIMGDWAPMQPYQPLA